MGVWSAKRWDQGGSRGLLGQAALITLVFTLLLVPAAGPHQLVDRALDGAAHAHAYHGYVRTADDKRAQWVSGALRQGLQDGLLGGAVGLPLMLLGLALRPRMDRYRPIALIVAAAVSLPVLAAGAVGFSLAVPDWLHKDRHALGGHAPVVTSVTAGNAIQAGDLRVTVQFAKWVRQPRDRQGRRPIR
jgi:hypothetical protein